jgi:hypothetical protein
MYYTRNYRQPAQPALHLPPVLRPVSIAILMGLWAAPSVFPLVLSLIFVAL